MFSDIFISYLLNSFFYESKYSSLFNCFFISLSSFLKLIFYENEFIDSLVHVSGLNSIFHYSLDTFKILNSGKINVFLIHHILSIYIFTCEYIFRYEVYMKYILLFLIEFSSTSYNLFQLDFINKKTHKTIYVPARAISNILIVYYVLYVNIYTYQIEMILNRVCYSLLVLFNIGGILKSLNII